MQLEVIGMMHKSGSCREMHYIQLHRWPDRFNAMRSLANHQLFHSPTPQSVTGLANRILPVNQSVNQSVSLQEMSSSIGCILFQLWSDGVGGGSFKDDAMCTQLTVARETA